MDFCANDFFVKIVEMENSTKTLNIFGRYLLFYLKSGLPMENNFQYVAHFFTSSTLTFIIFTMGECSFLRKNATNLITKVKNILAIIIKKKILGYIWKSVQRTEIFMEFLHVNQREQAFSPKLFDPL